MSSEYGEMDARGEGIVKERLDLMSSYMYSFPHTLIFSTCNRTQVCSQDSCKGGYMGV